MRGGLLDADAQRLLDHGFITLSSLGFQHGFGLFATPHPNLGRLVNKGGAIMGSRCSTAYSDELLGGNGASVVVCRSSSDLFLPNPEAGLPATSVGVDDLALELLEAAIP